MSGSSVTFCFFILLPTSFLIHQDSVGTLPQVLRKVLVPCPCKRQYSGKAFLPSVLHVILESPRGVFSCFWCSLQGCATNITFLPLPTQRLCCETYLSETKIKFFHGTYLKLEIQWHNSHLLTFTMAYCFSFSFHFSFSFKLWKQTLPKKIHINYVRHYTERGCVQGIKPFLHLRSFHFS